MGDLPKNQTESLLTFPCDFTIKVFGMNSDNFEAAVFSIIRKHAPNVSDRTFSARKSGSGKYMALSITVHVESKDQLDSIYQALSAAPEILMTL